MWIASQEFQDLKISARIKGRFAGWSDYLAARALMEWGWTCALHALASVSMNRAATAALDGSLADARRWLDRAEKLRALANE